MSHFLTSRAFNLGPQLLAMAATPDEQSRTTHRATKEDDQKEVFKQFHSSRRHVFNDSSGRESERGTHEVNLPRTKVKESSV